MKVFQIVNLVISVLFCVFYSYQLVYAFVALFVKKKAARKSGFSNRYAVLICARNEETVIKDLIGSIREQTYDADKITTFVVADNCTDGTARIAGDAGAIVYTRNDREHIGKGYALRYLRQQINNDYPDGFDGYFVFDADNILSKDYIEQMNGAICEGNDVVASYRNSKNFGDNWVTFSCGLMFLRESQFLNYPRSIFGVSCFVNGTGYYFSRRIADEIKDWPFDFLTEDAQFSIYNILAGRKIAYCREAVFYDEQPTKFSQSWIQRLRWCKGYWQVLGEYGKGLIKGTLTGDFSCYDMIMAIMPAFILSALSVISNLGLIAASFFTKAGAFICITSIASFLFNIYATVFVLGLLITISEWKRIDAAPYKKILYLFAFPVFMVSFCPIAIQSLFCKVEWKHIDHTKNVAGEKQS